MSFASPTNLTTQATFPQIGTYVLQLAVSDSQLTGTAVVRVILIGPCVQGLAGIQNCWPGEARRTGESYTHQVEEDIQRRCMIVNGFTDDEIEEIMKISRDEFRRQGALEPTRIPGSSWR
jgi:hypothetical protein